MRSKAGCDVQVGDAIARTKHGTLHVDRLVEHPGSREYARLCGRELHARIARDRLGRELTVVDTFHYWMA